MSPRWLHWPASANDWDTNEITRATGITLALTTYVPCSFSPATGEAQHITKTREQTVGTPRLRDESLQITAAFATSYPYMAVWNSTDSDWAVYDSPSVNPTNGMVDWSFVESRAGTTQADFLANGDSVVYLLLSAYTPGDISSWSNYA